MSKVDVYQSQKQRQYIVFFVFVSLLLSLLIFFFYALSAGDFRFGQDYFTSVRVIIDIICHKLFGLPLENVSKAAQIVLWDIRLPRIVLTMLSGASLAVAGAVYQACFKNPLVEPYLLGVSSGAAFGAALAIVMPTFFLQGQVSAFFFAILAVLLSYGLATGRGVTSPLHLILSGIVVGAVFTALVSILKYVAEDAELREITFWIMGGFYYAHWDDVFLSFWVTIPSICLLSLFAWRLNILSLGEDEAMSLGVNPHYTRLFFLSLATLIAAVCVSQVGIIAWVGLMIPHACRILLGSDNRYLIGSSALMGALYMLLCDTIARNLTGAEIPIAIISSLLGAPYLIYLLRSKGRDIHAS